MEQTPVFRKEFVVCDLLYLVELMISETIIRDAYIPAAGQKVSPNPVPKACEPQKQNKQIGSLRTQIPIAYCGSNDVLQAKTAIPNDKRGTPHSHRLHYSPGR